MTAIAVLATGECIPLTDSWDEARRLWREGGYDDVERIELESETPGSGSPESGGREWTDETKATPNAASMKQETLN